MNRLALPPSTPQAWLHELERFFRYCSGLRERRPLQQRQYFATVLGIGGALGQGCCVGSQLGCRRCFWLHL